MFPQQDNLLKELTKLMDTTICIQEENIELIKPILVNDNNQETIIGIFESLLNQEIKIYDFLNLQIENKYLMYMYTIKQSEKIHKNNIDTFHTLLHTNIDKKQQELLQTEVDTFCKKFGIRKFISTPITNINNAIDYFNQQQNQCVYLSNVYSSIIQKAIQLDTNIEEQYKHIMIEFLCLYTEQEIKQNKLEEYLIDFLKTKQIMFPLKDFFNLINSFSIFTKLSNESKHNKQSQYNNDKTLYSFPKEKIIKLNEEIKQYVNETTIKLKNMIIDKRILNTLLSSLSHFEKQYYYLNDKLIDKDITHNELVDICHDTKEEYFWNEILLKI